MEGDKWMKEEIERSSGNEKGRKRQEVERVKSGEGNESGGGVTDRWIKGGEELTWTLKDTGPFEKRTLKGFKPQQCGFDHLSCRLPSTPQDFLEMCAPCARSRSILYLFM